VKIKLEAKPANWLEKLSINCKLGIQLLAISEKACDIVKSETLLGKNSGMQ